MQKYAKVDKSMQKYAHIGHPRTPAVYKSMQKYAKVYMGMHKSMQGQGDQGTYSEKAGPIQYNLSHPAGNFEPPSIPALCRLAAPGPKKSPG